jgi:hypothetical protein
MTVRPADVLLHSHGRIISRADSDSASLTSAMKASAARLNRPGCIRVGRRIGSAALVADGLHARTDGFTSLAVVVAAAGAWAGWTWADPVVGLAITVAIAFVLKDAAREVYWRLMDAVDPTLVDQAETKPPPFFTDAFTLPVRGQGAPRTPVVDPIPTGNGRAKQGKRRAPTFRVDSPSEARLGFRRSALDGPGPRGAGEPAVRRVVPRRDKSPGDSPSPGCSRPG